MKLGILLLLYTFVPTVSFSYDCLDSSFKEPVSDSIKQAKKRFFDLRNSPPKGDKAVSILEVSIIGKSISEIEDSISDGIKNYFVKTSVLNLLNDGFSQTLDSIDGKWKKTIKVTTSNPNNENVTPYVQIFYEDNFGGVIRLKPNGLPDSPNSLKYLTLPHGTVYFKLNPNGDLSYENEAFKIYSKEPIPKAAIQVNLPLGVEFGSVEGEEYLKECWSLKAHTPLKKMINE